MGLFDFAKKKDKTVSERKQSSNGEGGGLKKVTPSNTDKICSELAVEFVAKKNYPKALSLLDQIFDKKNEGDWYTKGNILSNMNKYEDALKCYEKALTINPKHIKSWYRKGWAFGALKQPDKAIACFEKVLVIEKWLLKAFTEKAIQINPNAFVEAASYAVKNNKDKNFWSPAAVISETYMMMANANLRHGNITDGEAAKIQKYITYSWLTLRAYPIWNKLPDVTAPGFINKTMPDFIFLNIQGILNLIEPHVAVEFTVKGSKSK